jgi:hypothetical protein
MNIGIEVLLVGLIGSTIATLITLERWNRLRIKYLQVKQDYELRRFKLGKRYKLKENQVPNRPRENLLDSLRGIDLDKIHDLLDAVQGNTDTDESDALANIVNNPTVMKIIEGYMGGNQAGKKNPPDTGY